MISYNGNFEAKKDSVIENLPAGVYVGKIIGAKVETQSIAGKSVDRLVIQLDVSEGEYTGHYRKQFEAAKGGRFTPKYKGVFRITIPQSGDQYESINKRILQNAAWALEQSNSGYKWDWDESKLKGLTVGFAVREADFVADNQLKTTTEICRLDSADDVRSGKAKTPKRRDLSEKQKQLLRDVEEGYTPLEGADEELPF